MLPSPPQSLCSLPSAVEQNERQSMSGPRPLLLVEASPVTGPASPFSPAKPSLDRTRANTVTLDASTPPAVTRLKRSWSDGGRPISWTGHSRSRSKEESTLAHGTHKKTRSAWKRRTFPGILEGSAGIGEGLTPSVNERGPDATPPTPTPLTLAERNADLLQFIAQKESICLDLRTQLSSHEAELLQFKKEWERIVALSYSRTHPSAEYNPVLAPSSTSSNATGDAIHPGNSTPLPSIPATPGNSPSSCYTPTSHLHLDFVLPNILPPSPHRNSPDIAYLRERLARTIDDIVELPDEPPTKRQRTNTITRSSATTYTAPPAIPNLPLAWAELVETLPSDAVHPPPSVIAAFLDIYEDSLKDFSEGLDALQNATLSAREWEGQIANNQAPGWFTGTLKGPTFPWSSANSSLASVLTADARKRFDDTLSAAVQSAITYHSECHTTNVKLCQQRVDVKACADRFLTKLSEYSARIVQLSECGDASVWSTYAFAVQTALSKELENARLEFSASLENVMAKADKEAAAVAAREDAEMRDALKPLGALIEERMLAVGEQLSRRILADIAKAQASTSATKKHRSKTSKDSASKGTSKSSSRKSEKEKSKSKSKENRKEKSSKGTKHK
ncbi:hypothetical protein V5O48_013697 [Marasmius crinis-equi]|uniref:Uncharacterized protein n=1 Tax=Marasmius crinis-equi TaxID=585013 RepID=A0ABR3EZD6_9AGAR